MYFIKPSRKIMFVIHLSVNKKGTKNERNYIHVWADWNHDDEQERSK